MIFEVIIVFAIFQTWNDIRGWYFEYLNAMIM